MAVHIRMARHGSKKAPFYRIVVTDQRSPRDGRYIENIGTFDPRKGSGEGLLELDQSRFDYWCSRGAKPSETIDRLVRARAKAAASAESAG